MNYSVNKNDIHLVQPDFSLDETLDCGQAFRWVKISDNTYQGFSADKPLIISEDNGEFIFHDTSEDVFLNYWCEYFDLNTDYSELKIKIF